MKNQSDIVALMNLTNKAPLELYEYLLIGPLSNVYSAIKKHSLKDWQKYSSLLIDKFAIHSMSFYHLSKGIVEQKSSSKKEKRYGYDLFTINSVFRAIMETYATFNNIYVESKSDEETKFRYLLWKVDGLYDKQKYKINTARIKGAKESLEKDDFILKCTIQEIENCSFIKKIDLNELIKIFNPEDKKVSWRFLYENSKIKPLNITALIEHTCKTDSFINNYRYASTHTHSNYLAIEHFENYRGKPIPEEYTLPFQKLAVFITSMFIMDICSINENSKKVFKTLPLNIQNYISGITNTIKNS